MSAGFSLQAGELRHRLAVERQVSTPDGLGGEETVWQPAFECWAALRPVGANAFARGGKAGSQISHTILIRFRDDIEPDMRASMGARSFEIIHGYDPDESGRYSVMEAREIL